ncbi:hypothetical protein EJB05_29603, partial [Eragrostis curvula]
MARARGDSDPELAARLLARSPTSPDPSRSQQQPPPRAPPAARRQPPPPTITEGPGKQPVETTSAPSQRTAPPPPRRAAALHPAPGGAPLMPDARRRVRAPSPFQQQEAVASAAAALQPRQGTLVETVVARAQPPPPPTIAEGPGKQPAETTSGPSRRTAPPPPRRAAALHPAPGGAPQMPNAPAPRRRVHAPSPSQQREAVASAATALQPRQGTRVETVVARAQQPTPCTEEGEHAAAAKGEEPHHNSKQRPHRISNQCVPNSVKPPLKPSLQPRQEARVEMMVTRAQQPTPCTGEGEHAAAAKGEEPHLCSKQQRGVTYSEGDEDKENHSEECLNRVRKSPVPNTSQSVVGSISNPTYHEIIDSIAAFATNKSDELDVVRDAIMVLPKGPRSMLYSDQSSDGGDCGGVGTSTSAVIHSHARGTAGSTKPVVTFDVGLELARFGYVRSDPWKAIWEQQPLILHDADIVRAAKGIGCQVDVLKTITSVLQQHPGPVRYFRVDSCQIIKGRDQLEEWCDLLKKKQVEEVVVVNSRWPNDILDFPINDLNCESLRQLRLCFFRVSDIVIPYVDNLTTIDLCCCTISTLDLYALVDQCKSLKELDIGYYEGDIIRIDSKSLEILLVWQSTVKMISVKSALKLRRVLLAARPKKTDVGVWIDGARVLTDVWLNLSTQSITINNISFNKDSSPLPSLKRLVLNIPLLIKKERKTLLNLLKSCTKLKELTLWRNDGVSDQETFDAIYDDWPEKFKNLSCLKLHLQVFNMKDFRGGESEIAIASAVLEHAFCLKQLNLEADVNSSDETVFDRSKRDLQMTVQASPSAVVNYGTVHNDVDSTDSSYRCYRFFLRFEPRIHDILILHDNLGFFLQILHILLIRTGGLSMEEAAQSKY